MTTSLSIEPKAAPLHLAGAALTTRDVLGITDLSRSELLWLMDLAGAMKRNPRQYAGVLGGQSITMLFEKPSLRTRMSFEIGLTKLGAHVVYFDHASQPIGTRECVKDYAKNLERWTDALVCRVFDHAVLRGLAQHGSIPVINALSDLEHPCQALADMFTLQEHFGTLDGVRLAYVGDGNNVCNSLMLAAAKLGVHMTIVCPKGFEPSFEVVRTAMRDAEQSGATLHITHTTANVKGHHAVYTDTWVSMGQAEQSALRGEAFSRFQVDDEMMQRAGEGLAEPSVFMHCLPAHRGCEVTDDVIDSPGSLVYDQAENRMHVQNALMLSVLGE